MKHLAIIFLLSLVMMPLAMGTVTAIEEPVYYMDPVVTTQATNTTNVTGGFEELFGTLLGLIPKTIEIIIDIMLMPLKAVGTVFQSWGATLGGWYGPIVAAFVIIVILLMVRLYSEVDEWFDKNSG